MRLLALRVRLELRCLERQIDRQRIDPELSRRIDAVLVAREAGA